MSRLSSKGTRLWLQADAEPAGSAIAAISQDAPCVVTMAGVPPFAAGVIVAVDGTGWRSLDGRAFKIGAIDGPLVLLTSSDTTGETTAAMPGTLAPIDLIEFCLGSLEVNAPASTDIDTTTIYEEARSIRSGMPAVNTWQSTGFWDASDQAQIRVQALYRSRDVVWFMVEFSDASGLMFQANINTLDTLASVDQPIAIKSGGSISGTGTLLLPNDLDRDFNWIIAGTPSAPSTPDFILAGRPDHPSANTIVGGQAGETA